MSSSSSGLSSEWESYLRFLIDHELEEAYELQPINRTVAENKSHFTPQAPPALVAPAQPLASGAALRPEKLRNFNPEQAKAHAAEKARAAADLDGLYAALEAFEDFPLRYEGAKNRVTGRFASSSGQQARFVIIGEAPDREEDETGLPFAGKPGQLLDSALKALGVHDQTYLLPGLYWRAAGGRPPTDEDVHLTAPFTRRAVEILAPERIILLGATAARVMLGATEGIQKLRGRAFSLELADRKIPAFASYPPALVISQPLAKALLWRDLLTASAE